MAITTPPARAQTAAKSVLQPPIADPAPAASAPELQAPADATQTVVVPAAQQDTTGVSAVREVVNATHVEEAAELPMLVATADADDTPPPATSRSASPLRALHRQAVARLAAMNTYCMRLKRREVIAGQAKPEEVILCRFRKEPFSVYMKWIGAEAKGREVIYVKGKYDNKMHTLVAAGDVPLMPAGKYMTFAVDSILLKSTSRYPITEAGLANLIEKLGQGLDAFEKGDLRYGTFKYLGAAKRPEFDTKLEAMLHTIPPRSDPLFPNGGQRHIYFDPAIGLPVLIVAQDETGREVEYYCHDRFMIPGHLDDHDFDPTRWEKPKVKTP